MRARATMLLLAGLAGPAAAVGLGPLAKEGVIDGPRKAFYLTLYNPYDEGAEFVAYPVSVDGETEQTRVTVFPADAHLSSHETRRLLVVADGLQVGERYSFRVCAERKAPPQGITINARVCSKLTARRVG